MKDIGKFMVEVSVGYLTVKNTVIEVSARSEEEAENLAIEYARSNHDIYDWVDCPVMDVNYQIENL